MVYFVRHGLSEANVKRVFAGQRDDSILTDVGREQALETGNAILKAELHFERIVSSPSKRAFETAEIITRQLDEDPSAIIIDARINEYDMGSLSGTPWHTISSAILVNAQGAEDPELFKQRVIDCIKEYNSMEGDTLIVSHGGVGRMLETIKAGRDAKLFYDFPIYENASVRIIDWI